jgi:HD-GYP domain-containing protein (c-di-GMP phosphodiesterase class II)
MSHKISVPSSDLKIGMFVSDLDRPWVGTPFLLQGFLIEDETQLAQLREHCREVTVDQSRSLGDLYRHRGHFTPSRTPANPGSYRQPDDAGNGDFAAICRHLRSTARARRFTQRPAIEPNERQSRLEAELIYSAPIVDDLKASLRAVRDALEASGPLPLEDVAAHITEIAESVERNPDAMLWLARLRSTDQYSYDHAVDVSIHLMVFGRFLGLPRETLEDLGLAGLLQDIGKGDISSDILNKTDPLSDEEYALIQSHVAGSLEMLIGNKHFPKHLLDIVASHHERADGSGYPRKLKGERIGFHAELAGIVDSYCAMIRDRAYGDAVSSQKAMETLVALRGSKFRDAVVDQFIQCLGLYPVGSLVELNSGEVGVVIAQNRVRRLKPRLLIVLAPDKSVEHYPVSLDLLMNPETPDGSPYQILRALPLNAYGINPAEFYLG